MEGWGCRSFQALLGPDVPHPKGSGLAPRSAGCGGDHGGRGHSDALVSRGAACESVETHRRETPLTGQPALGMRPGFSAELPPISLCHQPPPPSATEIQGPLPGAHDPGGCSWASKVKGDPVSNTEG